MNESIGKALRELTRPTTPRELEARGVHRLRSIPLSQVSRMIEFALDQALSEHVGELSEGERLEVVEVAEGRLRTVLSTERQLSEAAEDQREAQDEEPAGEASSLDEDAAHVAALLDAAEGDPTSLRRAVASVVERAREREALLERRIAKLLRSAEKTEAALESALSCFGRSHWHRSDAPRGVKEDDPRREQKLSMMEGVLRMNQGLRRD